MLTTPMDILAAYPVRKSKKQKRAFREEVQTLAESWGYAFSTEKSGFGGKNLIIGDPAKAKYLFTAHYDTCVRLPVPNLITPKSLPLFLLYQLALCAFLLILLLVLPQLLSVAAGLLVGAEEGHIVYQIAFWSLYLLIFFGPANKTNANDNTSGVITALETAGSLPEHQRDKVCFILFDLEEAGLLGSMGYAGKHKKEIKNQIVLNLDCVGDGDELYFFPTKKLKKSPEKLEFLDKAAGTFGNKSITIHKKGFSVYPSDQANFPYGVGICALRRYRGTLYMSRIHTSRDTVLEETNVNLLRTAIISMISGDAAQ